MKGARTVTGRYVVHEPTLHELSEDEGLKAMAARLMGSALGGLTIGPSAVELTAFDTSLLARTARGTAVLDATMMRHRLESELPSLEEMVGKMNLEDVAKRFMVLDSVLPAQRQRKSSNTTLIAMMPVDHRYLDFYGMGH